MHERDDENGPRRATPTHQQPLLLLTGSALFALVLGDAAIDVGTWIGCAGEGAECTHDTKVTATALATLVSTFVAVQGAASATLHGDSTTADADIAILGALAGALFALLKASEGGCDSPQFSLLWRPLLVYVVVALVVSTPLLLARRGRLSPETALELNLSVAIVVIGAAALGGLWQVLVTELWKVDVDDRSARKFVVAPMVPVVATAVSFVLTADRWTRRREHVLVTTGWIVLAALAVFVFFVTAYLPEHNGTTGWVTVARPTATQIGLYYCLLLLIGVMMAAVLSLAHWERWGLFRRVFAVTLFSAVAAGCGVALGEARQSADRLGESDPIVLGIVQGLGPPLGLLALSVGMGLQRRLTRRRRGRL